MSKIITVTLQDELFRRLEEFRKSSGRLERSPVVQKALSYFLGASGPDARVLKRWGQAYARVRELEAARADAWSGPQGAALGKP